MRRMIARREDRTNRIESSHLLQSQKQIKCREKENGRAGDIIGKDRVARWPGIDRHSAKHNEECRSGGKTSRAGSQASGEIKPANFREKK